MVDVRTQFSSLVQASSVAYGVAYSHRRFTLLTKSDRSYLLQSATGVLMESLFFNLSKKLGCTQIIECGAHDAVTSQKFVHLNSGKALAIEANPFVHSKYKQQYFDSSVDYRSIGLAKTPAILEMNIPSHHTNESSLEGSLKKRDDFKSYRTIQINVDTLDHLARNFIKASATCLWIDVEGLGGEVLEGAHDVLCNQNLKLIYIEVQEDRAYYSDELNALEISEKLSFYDFIPVARDYPASNLYNLMFVRASCLDSCSTEISKFWISYTNLTVPFARLRSPRDLVSKLKNKLTSSYSTTKPSFLDHLFSLAGSKSSKQKIRDWDSSQQ
jgi:FkbM family methyltransferase